LSITLQRTTAKGIKLWRQEKRLLEVNPSRIEFNTERGTDDGELRVFADPGLHTIMSQESKTPILPFIVMLLILAVTSVISLLHGSSRSVSLVGVHPCSPAYWSIASLSIPLLIAATIGVAWYLMKQHTIKLQHNYEYHEDDVVWTNRNTTIMVTASFVGGFLAGLLGIGGGMVFGPLLLEFKMLPEVVAATSSFMILFTSVAAVIQFAVLDRLIPDYALCFVIIGFSSSLLGQFLLTKTVKKYGKTSLIVLCVSVVIGLSTMLLVTVGIMNIVEDVKANVNFGFKPIC